MRKLDPIEIQNILYYKEYLMIINDIKFFIYLTNMISILHQRNEIIKQRKNSLFKSIDHNLNEALFKNLINRSINPSDNNLSEEYSKILNESKNNQNCHFDKTDDNNKNHIDIENKGEGDCDYQNNQNFDNTDDNINNIENIVGEVNEDIISHNYKYSFKNNK